MDIVFILFTFNVHFIFVLAQNTGRRCRVFLAAGYVAAHAAHNLFISLCIPQPTHHMLLIYSLVPYSLILFSMAAPPHHHRYASGCCVSIPENRHFVCRPRASGPTNRTVTNIGSPSYKTHMKLTIFNVTMDDYDMYKCVARNPRGETDGTIRLYRKSNLSKCVLHNNNMLCVRGEGGRGEVTIKTIHLTDLWSCKMSKSGCFGSDIVIFFSTKLNFHGSDVHLLALYNNGNVFSMTWTPTRLCEWPKTIWEKKEK